MRLTLLEAQSVLEERMLQTARRVQSRPPLTGLVIGGGELVMPMQVASEPDSPLIIRWLGADEPRAPIGGLLTRRRQARQKPRSRRANGLQSPVAAKVRLGRPPRKPAGGPQ